jgi:hypothetical protein
VVTIEKKEQKRGNGNEIKSKWKRKGLRNTVWEWGPFVLTLRFEVTVHFVGPASDRRPPFADTHLLACRKKNFIEFEISFYLSKEGPKINFRKLFLSSYWLLAHFILHFHYLNRRRYKNEYFFNNFDFVVRYLSSGLVSDQDLLHHSKVWWSILIGGAKITINGSIQMSDVSHLSHLFSTLFSCFNNFSLFSFCHFVCK